MFGYMYGTCTFFFVTCSDEVHTNLPEKGEAVKYLSRVSFFSFFCLTALLKSADWPRALQILGGWLALSSFAIFYPPSEIVVIIMIISIIMIMNMIMIITIMIITIMNILLMMIIILLLLLLLQIMMMMMIMIIMIMIIVIVMIATITIILIIIQ